MTHAINIEELEFRHPGPHDAMPIWHLIGEISGLERNTCYAYLLLCSHFAEGSLVATHEGKPIGFVLGYGPPKDPDTMFVWQIGVHQNMRGQGLAGALLSRFAELHQYRECNFLEATVGSRNEASQALFQSFARRRGVSSSQCAGFPAYLFPDAHEDEDLYRIGPLRS